LAQRPTGEQGAEFVDAGPVCTAFLVSGALAWSRWAVLRSVVDHFCERGRDDGPFVTSLQPLQIALGQDALASGLRYGNAANAERDEHGIRLRLGAGLGAAFGPGLGAALFPAFLRVFGRHGSRRLTLALDTAASHTHTTPDIIDELGYSPAEGEAITSVRSAVGGMRSRIE
jgi:hypothetical protein